MALEVENEQLGQQAAKVVHGEFVEYGLNLALEVVHWAVGCAGALPRQG